MTFKKAGYDSLEMKGLVDDLHDNDDVDSDGEDL